MSEYGLAVAIWDPDGEEIRLGYTEYTKGGMMFRYQEEQWGPTYDRTGNTPVDQVKVGESAIAEVFMAEKNLEKFADIFPAAKLITQGDKKKLVWGGMIGQGLKKFSKPLTLRPIENLRDGEAQDVKDDDITMYHAIPRAEFEFAFQLQQERIYKITFTGVPNDDGEMFSMGDDSITEEAQGG